ncbi:MAG: hypothetical protein AB9903_28550 [Vulcanimicrobiota bacterium]
METMRKKLAISKEKVEEINSYLLSPDNRVINDFLAVVSKYGTVEEINRKAEENGRLESLISRLEERKSPFVKDLHWLMEQRDKGAFISLDEYRKKVLGDRNADMKFDETFAVTLEISAVQYFYWIIEEAKQAIEKKELMPGRFIRVRRMKEQEEDADLFAVTAAMKIMGASCVETLDTKGTDGANIHLGGPETITGYFGGVGQPNTHALKWLDEFLYYYTNYGISQVLNVNPGTVILGYLLHKLGIHNEFKISVFMGNDNPYSILWTLMTAKLFSRDNNSVPLIGFNFSNSVNNETIEISAEVRKAFGLEDIVRFEHHILETYKSIVIQPYDRRQELLEIASKVKNISAKHEGGEVCTEKGREHPSDILDYFVPRCDIESKGLCECLLRNYLDKHDAVNNTAKALTEKGLTFVAANNLHRPLVKGAK